MSNPNTSTAGWKALAIAIVAVFVIMLALAVTMHVWPPIWQQWVSGAVSVLAAFISLKVTEGAGTSTDTSEPWKMYFGFFAIALSIFVYAIPISQHAVK